MCILKAMADVGTFLSGLGTIMLLAIAFWQVPEEIKKWRDRRNHDMKLKMAIDSVDISTSVSSAMSRLVKPSLSEEEKQKPTYHQVFNDRISSIQIHVTEFYRLIYKFKILFSEDETKDLRELVEQIYRKIYEISSTLQKATVFGLRQPNLLSFTSDLKGVLIYPSTISGPMIPKEVKELDELIEEFNEAVYKLMQK